MYKKAGDREKVVRIKSEIGVLVVVDKMVFLSEILKLFTWFCDKGYSYEISTNFCRLEP